MSMFIVSENCINDVANLIIKLYPYMDLIEVCHKLIRLNLTIYNNKYNENEDLLEYIGKHNVQNYSKHVYVDKYNVTCFKDEYVPVIQLIESLDCYWYQIEENYIDNTSDRFTYSMIKELIENPFIIEIRDFIKYYKLDDNECKRVDMVLWNRQI